MQFSIVSISLLVLGINALPSAPEGLAGRDLCEAICYSNQPVCSIGSYPAGEDGCFYCCQSDKPIMCTTVCASAPVACGEGSFPSHDQYGCYFCCAYP
ncbi:hypothetical protein GQ53DRAFT_825840 [Thozetella sp. PMI_491]|nr:hypothetical protein GQ53DRAFT_825840 [Thozetella sp. PMI_491]